MSCRSDGKNPFDGGLMWLILLFLCAVAWVVFVCLMSSCRGPKVIEKVVTEVEYRDREVHDTVSIEIPKETIINVTTDTISNLETDFARSTAIIDAGFLRHTLENKQQTISKPIVIHVTDTIIKEKEAEILPPEIVKVEKELSWWQRVRLDTYYILLGVIALFCLLKYRKGLFTLIKSKL